MLSRVVLGSLLVSGAAHADPTQIPDGIEATAPDDDGPDHRVDAVLGTGGAGARYTVVGEQLVLEMQALAEADRQAASAKLGLARFETYGIEHDIVTGVGLVQASSTSEASIGASPMLTHSGRSSNQHRFLSAYINDTVRFIRGLDITGGLVVEQWSNLGGDSTITYASGPPMDVDTPVTSVLFAPTAAINGHLHDRISLVAQTHRGVHEIGPNVSTGRFAGRARAFSGALGAGAAAEVSVQPVAPVIATIGYTHATSMKLAAVAVTYNDPRIVSVTTRADTASRVDALAVRRIHGGFAGFVGVDNLLDRRAVDSAPRLFHVGVRYASR